MAMSTSSGSADYGLFDELAEEFAERYRRGERPSLQEYVDRCPEMTTAANPKFPAADWLVLALAHAKLKETDQARKAAALLKPTGAENALRPLLREVLIAVGPDTPEATAIIAAAAGEPRRTPCGEVKFAHVT